MTLIRPSLDLSRVTAWGGANQGVIVLFLQKGGQDMWKWAVLKRENDPYYAMPASGTFI